MAKVFLCESGNGKQVFFDDTNSHAATHFDDTPQLKDLMCEVLQSMDLETPEIATHVDMGRVVGTCDVVTVSSSDEVVYGMRRNRETDGLVPFVKNRKGDPCSTVALHLIRQPDGEYKLSSAWIGTFGGDDEPFPNAPDATERSLEFWSKHAFIYGSQEILPGTETAVRAW